MRVGIIGIGTVAQAHIAALIEAGQSVVALCDIDITRCEKANRDFSFRANIYSDYRQMIECETLDVVHICTPHYLHAEMICFALDRNINVLSENPMAISFEQLEQIEKSVRKSSARLGVCQQNRFRSSMRFVKEYFKDKEITAANGIFMLETG